MIGDRSHMLRFDADASAIVCAHQGCPGRGKAVVGSVTLATEMTVEYVRIRIVNHMVDVERDERAPGMSRRPAAKRPSDQ